jgi:8-oxo-dGTP diphosphatase
MDDPAADFATPRLASGALFVDGSKVFLIRKTYGNHWDLPGGYVERGESPASACEREVREELSLDVTVRRLLVHDWAPNDGEGDKILYVFDCGQLGEAEQRVRLDGVEIDTAAWVEVGDLPGLVIPRLERRLAHAYLAHTSGGVLYLENGSPRAPTGD